VALRFNPPPNWPPVSLPDGWLPPAGWVPPSHLPSAPPGWAWVIDDGETVSGQAKNGVLTAWDAQRPWFLVFAPIIAGAFFGYYIVFLACLVVLAVLDRNDLRRRDIVQRGALEPVWLVALLTAVLSLLGLAIYLWRRADALGVGRAAAWTSMVVLGLGLLAIAAR